MKINKKFIPQFVKARDLYFIALAMNETNIKIDNDAKNETLKENEFFIFKGELNNLFESQTKNKIRLLDFKQDYLLSDGEFIRYLKIVHEKRVKAGLKLPYHKFDWAISEPFNLSTDCETRPILRAAEDALIESGLNLLPLDLLKEFRDLEILENYTYKEKVLDLVLRLDVGIEPQPMKLITEMV